MIINNLLNFFKQNKKILFFVSLIFTFLFLSWDMALAADGNWFDVNNAKETVSTIVQWIASFVTVFLSLLTYLSVMFLSPEWINGNLFGLNVYFKQIWILVSNLVYFIFAFILIWIAFMNIIWKWQDKYQLKQALPKFIVWILIVPISWFLVNFILSISAILTISAVNLPFDTFSWFNQKIWEVTLPTNCTLDFRSTWWENEETEEEWEENINKFYNCEEWEENRKKIVDIMNSQDSSDSIFWVLWLYTYWILWIENIDNLNFTDLSAIRTLWDLIVKIVFDILFVVVYAILMIALAFVLMTRWIYIWIYIMISPLFWLMYFFDKTSGWWEFFDKFNIKQFISLSMVPVYTMLALSFWMLFMFVIWSQMWASTSWTENNSSVRLTQSTEDWSDVLNIWEFKLEILWSPANPENITWLLWKISDNALWVVWTLIMKIFWIVVLWGAVMAALRTNEVTKWIVEPLYSLWNQVWQLAAKSPQYAPVFGWQSMQSMKTVWWAVEWHVNQSARDRATSFTNKHMPFLDASSTWQKANLETLSSNLKSGSYETANSPQALSPAWREYLKNIWDTEWAKRLDTEDILKQFSEKLNIDLDWINFNSRTWYAEAIKKIETSFDSQWYWVLEWNVSRNAQLGQDDIDNLIRQMNNPQSAQQNNNNNQQQNNWNNANQVIINLNNNENLDLSWKLSTDDTWNVTWLNSNANIDDIVSWINLSEITKTDFISQIENQLKARNDIDDITAQNIANAIANNINEDDFKS